MNIASLMLSHDKANHVVWGYGIACVAALLAPSFGIPPTSAAQVAAFAAGLAKEVYDWKHGTGFNATDLAVTTLAGTPVALALL